MEILFVGHNMEKAQNSFFLFHLNKNKTEYINLEDLKIPINSFMQKSLFIIRSLNMIE